MWRHWDLSPKISQSNAECQDSGTFFCSEIISFLTIRTKPLGAIHAHQVQFPASKHEAGSGTASSSHRPCLPFSPHVNILQPDLKAHNPEDPFQAQRLASPSFYTGNISERLWDVQTSWIPVGEPCNPSGVTRKVAILKILFLPRLAAPVWRVSPVFPLEPRSVHTSTPWLPQRWLRRC